MRGSSPRMTSWGRRTPHQSIKHTSAFPRHVFARGMQATFRPLKLRGRREDRVRAAPAVSCANCTKKRTRAYRFSGNTPAFPAQWFYGLLRALLGDRLCCHRRLAGLTAKLDASIGAPEPHDFAVRNCTVRPRAHARPAPSRPPRPLPNVRDDHDPPLLRTGDGTSL